MVSLKILKWRLVKLVYRSGSTELPYFLLGTFKIFLQEREKKPKQFIFLRVIYITIIQFVFIFYPFTDYV